MASRPKVLPPEAQGGPSYRIIPQAPGPEMPIGPVPPTQQQLESLMLENPGNYRRQPPVPRELPKHVYGDDPILKDGRPTPGDAWDASDEQIRQTLTDQAIARHRQQQQAPRTNGQNAMQSMRQRVMQMLEALGVTRDDSMVSPQNPPVPQGPGYRGSERGMQAPPGGQIQYPRNHEFMDGNAPIESGPPQRPSPREAEKIMRMLRQQTQQNGPVT